MNGQEEIIMTRLRSYLDPDQHSATGPTPFMTDRNDHEVRCGICSRPLFVDGEALQLANEAMTPDSDYPFRCEVCTEEYERAYED
jgi:hypothetical protein